MLETMSKFLGNAHRKLLTLVLIRDEANVLLGMKKRGFGAGFWNGFGGKVDVGESIVQAAKRELEEEICVTCDNLREVGMLEFEFVGDPKLLQVHVFTSRKYSGHPTETEEMRPQWFAIDAIPFDQMWEDDRVWYPFLLRGDQFIGYFRFTSDNKLIDYTIKTVDRLDYGDFILKGS